MVLKYDTGHEENLNGRVSDTALKQEHDSCLSVCFMAEVSCLSVCLTALMCVCVSVCVMSLCVCVCVSECVMSLCVSHD